MEGSFAYEFRMQARRPAVWIVLLLVLGGTVAGTGIPFQAHAPAGPGPLAGEWAFAVQSLAPAAFGCLLADRTARERRLRVDELFAALPAPPGRLLLGKVLGAGAATLLPVAALFAAGSLYLAAAHGAAVLPRALAAFGLVDLPGLWFVAAFSVACPAVMPVALYQFLFVGYWFWGNFLPPGAGIPTLSPTILTPVGGTALRAFFHVSGFGARPAAAPAGEAVASIALLAGLGAAAIAGAHLVLQRQRALRAGGPWQAAARGAAAGARVGPEAAESGPPVGPGLALLRYELRVLGPGVLLTPLLVVAVFDGFALLAAVVGGGHAVARVLTAALEIGLSLGAGLAAANLVAAEPAVELHLALRRGYRATALRRLALSTGWTCLLSAVLSAVLALAGGWRTGEPYIASQLVWAAPVLWMTGLGGALALAFRSRAAGVGVVVGVWLAEFIAHGSFRAEAWLRPVDLFATSFATGAPWWLRNRLELLAVAALLGGVCWWLLGDREAMVGSAHE